MISPIFSACNSSDRTDDGYQFARPRRLRSRMCSSRLAIPASVRSGLACRIPAMMASSLSSAARCGRSPARSRAKARRGHDDGRRASSARASKAARCGCPEAGSGRPRSCRTGPGAPEAARCRPWFELREGGLLRGGAQLAKHQAGYSEMTGT